MWPTQSLVVVWLPGGSLQKEQSPVVTEGSSQLPRQGT